MTKKTQGIILKVTDTSSSDKLLHILTEDLGLISAFVNLGSAKNKKNSQYDLFSYGEFVFFKTAAGNYLVNSFFIIENFYSIRENIAALALAGYFAQVAIFALKDRTEYERQLLSLVLNSLYLLSKGQNMQKVKAVFEIKVVQFLGFTPSLEVKEVCSQYYFSLEDGALLPECSAGSIMISNTGIQTISFILSNQVKRAFSFKINEREINQLSLVSEKYFLYQVECTFPALEFYHEVV